MAKKKSRKKLFIILGIFIILIAAAVFIITSGNVQKPIQVITSKVERRTITQTVSAIGKIEAETEVKISSETSGEIIFLGVKEGDTVRANQLLVKIKPDIVETQLEQYKAAAESSKMEIDVRKSLRDNAQSELKRIKELYDKQFASQEEYEVKRAAYQQAEASLEASKRNYDQALASLKMIQRSASRTEIFSPINGVVTKLEVEKGEKVVGVAQMTGTEIMIISDLGVMNSMVEVDENDIVLVKVGDTARIQVDAMPDQVFNGTVIEIGHSAIVNQVGTQDQVTNFKVKVRFVDHDGRLRPGMSSNVDIETNTRQNIMTVPLQSVTVRDTKEKAKPEGGDDAIKKTEGNDSKDKKTIAEKKLERPPSVVFVKEGNKAKMINVKTGISDKGFIEIQEGLKDNDEVISGTYMAISKLLKDGSPIIVDTNLTKRKFDSK
jgi:HlyD family secretion protein